MPRVGSGACAREQVQECLQKRGGAVEMLISYAVDGKSKHVDFPPDVRYRQVTVTRTFELLRNFPIPPIITKQQPQVSHEPPPAMAPSNVGSGAIVMQVAGAQALRSNEEAQRERAGGRSASLVNDGCRGDEGGPSLSPEYLAALFEWSGAAACRLPRCSSVEGGSVVGYDWPVPWFGEAASGQVYALRWSGLILSNQVLACLEQAREMIKNQRVGWAVVNVWGFTDSPVSWGGREHGFVEGGNNDFTFFVLPGDSYILFSAGH
eukprot:TRINITY_DN4463_c0_g1_i3.p1 TRINITY_DN4463_c0_g1~~TRINITY_DN4463_c0_g1_i3.p1  ORF type:complete len:264 (+),score=44.45 TRINITY_DN4463_c0_g1_i3:87-878(+)